MCTRNWATHCLGCRMSVMNDSTGYCSYHHWGYLLTYYIVLSNTSKDMPLDILGEAEHWNMAVVAWCVIPYWHNFLHLPLVTALGTTLTEASNIALDRSRFLQLRQWIYLPRLLNLYTDRCVMYGYIGYLYVLPNHHDHSIIYLYVCYCMLASGMYQLHNLCVALFLENIWHQKVNYLCLNW